MARQTDSKVVKCFRCYVEVNHLSHRVVIPIDKSSTVRFQSILNKLRKLTQKEIYFGTHVFWVLNQNKRRFFEIRRKEAVIRNGEKIVATAKPRLPPIDRSESTSSANSSPQPKKETPKLDRNEYIFTLKMNLIQAVDDVLNNDKKAFDKWKAVTKLMRSKGYRRISPNRCSVLFHSVIQMFSDYLKEVCDKSEDFYDKNSIKMFRRMESLNLKPFLSSETYRWVEQTKFSLAVNQTMDWLLVQTSMASMDTDLRTDKIPEPSKTDCTKEPVLMSSTKPVLKPKKRSNGRKSFRKSETQFDSKLVSVIHKLEIKGQTYFDWTAVRQEMSAGADFYDSRFLKMRFQSLIWRYIQVMSHFETETDAVNDWSLFANISEIDLKPFCDRITYQTIQRLRERFTSRLDTISEGSQTSRKSTQYYYYYYYYYNKYSKFYPNIRSNYQ